MIHDLGLLTSRAVIGLGMAAHGAQKAFGWFGGPGPQGTANFLGSLGFAPSEKYAMAAAYNEFVSGMLVALGLGGAIGPAGIISGMIVAAMTVHAKNGFFVADNGVELPALYAASALALASSGYGALSLDHALGLDRKLRHPAATALVVAGGVASALAVLAQRNGAQAQEQPQAT